ncbi:hypothetical protein SEVIR_8G215266v4 [Setaria viridis]|uniref:PGG domain-containing protein n=1 Tax=Setaria viridis TaxID=4556 RepID=A0A4U6TLX3_SETVI|nr:hypothetical protein SEVIR_8G215266v2 [Setaria viridis]
MASVALIVLLLNPTLYGPGIRCYALFVCMVAGMFGLIGAYAAGSSLHLGTSIVDLALVLAVFSFVAYVVIIRHSQKNKAAGTGSQSQAEPSKPSGAASNHQHGEASKQEQKMMAKYLMLVGILAASVTYLTGLKPPGGLWREDDGNGHSAGNPVLYNIDKHRYNAFFYSNSTSFMASITVIALLLSRMILFDSKKPLWPMHTAMLLDMLALLGAYAAGSARDWCTSKDVILLLFPILGFVALLFFWKKQGDRATIPQNIANNTTNHSLDA